MHTTRIDKRNAKLKKRERGKRVLILGIIFTFFLIILAFRLFYIQIIKGEEYVDKVKLQQTEQIVLEEISGDILDRSGVSFTSAGEEWTLKIIPNTIGFDNKSYDVIESLTGIESTEFDFQSSETHNIPIINPDMDLLTDIEANKYPGVLCYKQSIRYDDRSLARHIIGYLRKSDNVPMSGIEKMYSDYLHPGLDSYINVFSDAANRPLFSFGYQIETPETKWYDVRLTLDYNIQDILERVLDKYPGRRHGGIVLDVASGDILALASRPQYKQYDPSAVQTNGMTSSFLAIPMEQYPLGSVFKIIVAAAALESGNYDEDTVFNCSGGIQLGNNWIPCHASTDGLGTITLREAFAHSCNDTFVRIAQEIGGEIIIKTAKQFGLGKPITIGLPNSAGGLMDKSRYAGSGIGNLALGQDTTMVTPLQASDMVTTVLNGGIRKPLRLIDGLVDSEGNLIELNLEQKESATAYRVISQQTAFELAKWMGDVTEYGTAKNINYSLIGGAGGKTGTPQVSGDLKSSNYGWFAGFFPKENPEYIIVVLSLEEGGSSDMAVPVFYDIARNIWLQYKS